MTRKPTHAQQIHDRLKKGPAEAGMSEKNLTAAQRNILASLRTGPKYGHELSAPEVGGIGFKERLRELRVKGYNIPHGKYVGPKRFVFRLIEDGPIVPGGGIASESPQEPSGCGKGSGQLSRPDALSPGRPPLVAVEGDGITPDISPAPALTTVGRPPAIPGWPDGRYVVCTYCSRAWDEDGSSQGCVCGKTAEWLLELHDERERDRIAARIDPAQVADRVAWANRFLDDREKAAA